MNGITYEVACSPYSLAYNVLRGARQHVKRRLSVHEAQEFLESTPELVFAPGTTIEEVLGKLQRWHLVQVEGNLVEVISNR
jgi:hypothetical protein